METRERPITGYLADLYARPGDPLVGHVSTTDPGPCSVQVVKVACADPNPDGPGLQLEDRADLFCETFEGVHTPIRRGSFGRIDAAPALPAAGAVTWTAMIQPTRLAAGPQAVLAYRGDGAAMVLGIDAGGLVFEVTRSGETSEAVRLDAPFDEGRWARVSVTYEPVTGAVVLGKCVPAHRYRPAREADGGGHVGPLLGAIANPVLLIATADADRADRHFNGRIEDVAMVRGARPDALSTLERFRPEWNHDERGETAHDNHFGSDDPTQSENDRGDAADLIAFWDFSIGIDTQTITDIGPGGHHGVLTNLPTRAVRGSRWTGAETCWRHARQHYAAIHFHDDDLSDCRWPAAFRFIVPEGMPSGAYAFEISRGDARDWLPFYVLPPKTGPHAPIAVLASTLTHQVYANHMRNNADEAYRARVEAWGAYPANPQDYPIYGGSCYNTHSDGTGIAYASRLRPMLTMRPGFLTFNDSRGSGLRHYVADSQLHAFLEARGHAFDIITDEVLDEEGVEALRPYRAVLTGSHPEYHTEAMLDALEDYVSGGGRLAYLGGNGFYWKIARGRELPHVVEIRRAEGGIRAWAAEPGEYFHAFDGAYGGLWRRNGRAPQALVGIGFSAQGLFEESGQFRRTAASYDERFAWLFDGVGGPILGDFGLGGGGAAGYELDRADTALGTLEGTTILARSEALGPSFIAPPEEILTHTKTVTGEDPKELVRGEMVYFEPPGGGAVFSAGSITFCGALPVNGFDNPVATLVDNLVRRFKAPAAPDSADDQHMKNKRKW